MRLKELEQENGKLKCRVAEFSFPRPSQQKQGHDTPDRAKSGLIHKHPGVAYPSCLPTDASTRSWVFSP
jgi:hypothetical protein